MTLPPAALQPFQLDPDHADARLSADADRRIRAAEASLVGTPWVDPQAPGARRVRQRLAGLMAAAGVRVGTHHALQSDLQFMARLAPELAQPG
jgi:hypothetical protein